jgi:hypothetical protein
MIKNSDLSEKTRKAIVRIQKHRKQVGFNTSMGFLGAALLMSLPHMGPAPQIKQNAASAFFASVFAIIGRSSLKDHTPTFRGEYVALFRSLRADLKRKPELARVIASSKYLVVDRKGNIVGKNNAPKIYFVPIGRRRFPNPLGQSFWRKRRK